jgi:hypothetical protein
MQFLAQRRGDLVIDVTSLTAIRASAPIRPSPIIKRVEAPGNGSDFLRTTVVGGVYEGFPILPKRIRFRCPLLVVGLSTDKSGRCPET